MPPKSSKTSSIAKKKKKTVVVDLSDSEDDNDMNSINSGDESEVLVVEPPKKSAASTKQKSPSKTKSPSSSKAPSSPKKLPKSPEAAEPVNDSFDVILPPLLGTNSNGECTILVQLDPHDAATLDYEGVSGAIGRFEADDRGGKYEYDSKQFWHHFANASLFDLRALTFASFVRNVINSYSRFKGMPVSRKHTSRTHCDCGWIFERPAQGRSNY